MSHYILDENKNPIKTDPLTWASFFSDFENRSVAQELVRDLRISTVFLGIDHGLCGNEPQLFETMVFNKAGESIYCERCATWDEAIAMHQKAVKEFE